MEEKKEKAQENFGLCLKQSDWTVLKQDQKCIKMCGDLSGTICHKDCYRLANENSLEPNSEQGIQSFRNVIVGNQDCDLALVFSENQIASILCPVGITDLEEQESLLLRGFTHREIEIMQLRKRGFKNIEIEVQLNISQSTLKTHISHILRKIGP